MADLVFLGIFAAFVVGGLRSGFVRRLAGVIYLAVSFVLGAYLRGPLGGLVTDVFPDIPKPYAEMVGYTAGFTVLVVVFNVFSSAILSRIATAGVSRVLDQVLGVVFGFVEAALICSAVIVILHTYSSEVVKLADLSGLKFLKDVADGVDASTIGRLLESTLVPLLVTILGPLLPQDIKSIVPTEIPGFPRGLPGLP